MRFRFSRCLHLVSSLTRQSQKPSAKQESNRSSLQPSDIFSVFISRSLGEALGGEDRCQAVLEQFGTVLEQWGTSQQVRVAGLTKDATGNAYFATCGNASTRSCATGVQSRKEKDVTNGKNSGVHNRMAHPGTKKRSTALVQPCPKQPANHNAEREKQRCEWCFVEIEIEH